jgi:hypothetical protein
MVTIATAENNTRFEILNVLQTISSDRNPDGAIKRMHTQTPTAQIRLISSEDFLLMIRRIKGMLNKGKTAAVITPIVSQISIIFSFIED